MTGRGCQEFVYITAVKAAAYEYGKRSGFFAFWYVFHGWWGTRIKSCDNDCVTILGFDIHGLFRYAPVVDDVMTSVFDVHITQGQNLVSL